MKKLQLSLGIVLAFAANCAMAQVPGKMKETGQVLLSNGWKLSPAGRSLQLGDLPLNIQLSPSEKLLAVTNNGQSTQELQLIDPQREKLLDKIELGMAWYGLAFNNDEKHLYVSGGNENAILDFSLKNNKLHTPDTIRLGKAWPNEKICPTGIAVTKDGSRLYTVTKENNKVYTVALQPRKVTDTASLPNLGYS